MVRRAAAQAFDASQQCIGPKAIDETIPTLLEAMSDPDNPGSETALSALREVMRARADVVFPVLVPTLTKQPISQFNARALTALVSVAGNALNAVLTDVLTALATSLETETDDAIRPELEQTVSTNLSAISDEGGLHQLMMLLLGWAGNANSVQRRVSGCKFMATFAAVKKHNISLADYLVGWIRRLVSLLQDPASEVVDAALPALDALFKTVAKEDLEKHVVPLRRAVESVSAPGEEVTGFCRPRGIGAMVPVFLAGLLNGTAEQREQGAYGLGDLVERTSAEAVKPFVITMVGPLIRACGDRHAPAVKVAILSALTSMLQRVPQHCRPFYPQLQRSFQKAVLDPASSSIRGKAAVGLGKLMAHQQRVDPVIAELVQAISAGLDPDAAAAAKQDALAGTSGMGVDPSSLAESAAIALVEVLDHAPSKNVSAATLQSIVDTMSPAFIESKDSIKSHVADVLAAVAVHNAELVRELLDSQVLCSEPGDKQLASQCVRAMLERAPAQLHEIAQQKDVVKAVLTWTGEAPAIARPARESRDFMKQKEPWRSDSFVQEYL